MRKQISFIISAVALVGLSGVEALKILMAGSLERSEHRYFESVAQYLSKNAASENEVYQLVHDVADSKGLQIKQVNPRLFTIQVPDHVAADAQASERRVARLSRFYWEPAQTEYDNYIALDVEHVEAYFAEDEALLTKLKEMKFEVGIGGSYHADSLLFRALGLNFIKLNPEDIESHTMQFKYNMPVMLSAYPSSQAAQHYDYDDLPHPDSHAYRKQFYKAYEYNRWLGRPLWMRKVRNSLPAKYHKALLDDFDQDHAMILGEGTKGLIYQSVMLKPPNVQPVYPLRDESESTRTWINLDSKALKRKGPLIIFNAELHDPKSALFASSHDHFFTLMKSFKSLKDQLGTDDFDVVVLYDAKRAYQVNMMRGKLAMSQVTGIETADPFNIGFTAPTLEAVKSHGRHVIWLSQCTQQNFLAAFEKFSASFVGFANRELSHTQTYNCHKIQTLNVGRVLDLDQLSSDPTVLASSVAGLVDMTKVENQYMRKNVTFHEKLLAEDERISRMDLEYWIDYVYLFGVGDLIPLYDKVDPITFRNWDVYAIYWLIFLTVSYINYKVFRCVYSCCCKPSKTKVE